MYVEIAVASGVTGGKWLIFVHKSTIDEVWGKIAKATLEGKLGTASKVCSHIVTSFGTIGQAVNPYKYH